MTATRARPVNPYIAGRALHQRSGFFGRDDILRLVETDLRAPDRNVIVLFGQRRIGKTSILLQLEQALPNPPFVAVHFDLMDRARQPLGQVLHDIAATLADELDIEIAGPEAFDNEGHYFQQQFLPELYRQLGPECRAVLLFDEFDVLDVAAEERLPDTAAARAFFPYLRQLMEEPELGFVFVVGRRAEDLSIDVKATFKAARYKRVSVLSLTDTQALIRLAEQQGSLQFAAGAVERIMALTAGHPYLTQLFCQILWDNAHASRPNTTPTIEPTMVEATVPQVLEAGQHAFEWIWDGLPPAERLIFAAIAEATDEASLIAEYDLIAMLQDRGIRILVRELELAPRTLVDWEMLRTVEGGYAFAVELLRRWVAQNKPLPRVKDELDRVVPFAETLYRGGEGWYRQRDLENAASQLRQALTVNPNHLKARLLLGQVLIEQGQLDVAIAELEEAYQYDAAAARYPLVRVLLDRAQRLERDKQSEVAVGLYERVLKISSREKIAHERYNAIWTSYGDVALQLSEFDNAIAAYEKAGAQEKIDRAVQLKRRQQYERMVQIAQQHEEHEEWAQAHELYQRLTAEFSTETDFYEELQRVQTEIELSEHYAEGLGFFEQGNWAKAQSTLAKVISKRPDYKNAAELLAQAVNNVRQGKTVASKFLPLAVDMVQSGGVQSRLMRSRQQAIQIMVAISLILIALIVPLLLFLKVITEQPEPIYAGLLIAFSILVAMIALRLAVMMIKKLPLEQSESSSPLLIQPFIGYTSCITSVMFSPDGHLALSGSDDKTLRLWKVTTGQELRLFSGHTSKVTCVAFSSAGQLILSGSCDKTLRLWNVATGEEIKRFTGHSGCINSVAFSPDGQTVLSGSDDKTLRLWNMLAGEEIKRFTGHSGCINSVAFSPDGQTVLSGSNDKTLCLWSVATGEEIKRFIGHGRLPAWFITTFDPLYKFSGFVNGVVFSPDGRFALSGATDKTVRLWSVATGKEIKRFIGHKSVVKSVTFSPDGELVLSGSRDKTLRLWSVATGKEIKRFTGHVGYVESVAFSPDGQFVLSSSNDGTLRLWKIN